jgi:predicted nucleic acid-binding protein
MSAERPGAARGKVFLDTNVLVYAVDEDEPDKRERARRLLAADGEGSAGRFVLSAQVLSEFYVTVTRKLARPLAEDVAAAAVELLGQLPTIAIDRALVAEAIALSRSARISHWDGLVVAAAARGGCARLLSEDLNDGQRIGGVLVENPFA